MKMRKFGFNFNFAKNAKIGNLLSPYKFFSTSTTTVSINNASATSTSTSLNSDSSQPNNKQIEKIIQTFNLGAIRRNDYITYLTYTQAYFQNYKKDIQLEEKRNAQKDFMKYLELSINKSVVTTSTVAEILPTILSTASKLEINTLAFWQLLNKLFSDVFHKLGTNLVFDILTQMNTYYPGNPNVVLLKNSYFMNLSRDKVLAYNTETLVNYLKVFTGLHQSQKLIDDIQQLIVVSLADKEANQVKVFENLLDVFYYYKNDKTINFNTCLIFLLPSVTKHFESINSDKIKTLKVFHSFAINNPSALKEVASLAEKSGSSSYLKENFNSLLKIEEVVELVDIYTTLNTGSHELFLNFEKFIGTHIDQLTPDKVHSVLNNFVKSKKYREKFPLLIQKKVNDSKLEINFSDLCKIMKIYTEINTSNTYIYDKLHGYFLSTLQFYSLEDLSNLIFAYSYNKNVNSEKIAEILQKAELNIQNLLKKSDSLSSAVVKILYGYTFSEGKLYQGTISQLLNILTSSSVDSLNITQENAIDVILLFKILEAHNLPFESFEQVVTSNLDKFSQEQLTELSAIIKRQSVHNTKLIQALSAKLQI